MIDRKSHTGSVPLAGGQSLGWAEVVDTLNRADVPEGTPFLIDEDGDLENVRRVNSYLLEATRQRAYAGTGLRDQHAPSLRRLLLFIRKTHGKVDLTATLRKDLIEYKTHRLLALSPRSWNTELSHIANFFHYATEQQWITRNPIPRWGTNNRSTLASRITTQRRERFLTERQLRFFLESGLRGDSPAPTTDRPRYAERDYSTGLLLVSTGMRREEARLILDCEIPNMANMPANGVQIFKRVGKGGVLRDVWITDGLVGVLDLYRSTDRAEIVRRAQPQLRKDRNDGKLLIVEQTLDQRGRPLLVMKDGQRCHPERLSNELRSRAASILPSGEIDPLPLFLVEGGHPSAPRTMNNVFNAATLRIANLDHPDLPPNHVDVTPHVMRHTFAVRMLAALMREGRENHNGNPFHLLASPEFTVQQLLGHADIATTNLYLHAAFRYNEDLPTALRGAVALAIGQPGGHAPMTVDFGDPE